MKRSEKMKFKKHLENQDEKIKINSINKDLEPTNVLRKHYKSRQELDIEFYTSNLLQTNDVGVARILSTYGNTAVIERVDGILYDKILERIEQGLLSQENIKRVATELCKWLKKYYAATKNASRGDISFKNFIFTTQGECVGINFEKPLELCRCEYDMGRILFYVATNEPMFTSGKLQMCKALLECFLEMNVDIDLIKKEYEAEFDKIKGQKAGFMSFETQVKDFWGLLI